MAALETSGYSSRRNFIPTRVMVETWLTSGSEQNASLSGQTRASSHLSQNATRNKDRAGILVAEQKVTGQWGRVRLCSGSRYRSSIISSLSYCFLSFCCILFSLFLLYFLHIFFLWNVKFSSLFDVWRSSQWYLLVHLYFTPNNLRLPDKVYSSS